MFVLFSFGHCIVLYCIVCPSSDLPFGILKPFLVYLKKRKKEKKRHNENPILIRSG
jgi:hypothetical protein